MQTLIGLVIGIAAGTHIATWGMFKDAPHEGFTRARYLRSIVVGAALGPGLAHLLAITDASPGNLLVLFGLTYVGERIVIEFWKTFLREEDQSKYFIPMQFHIGGRLVRNRRVRAAAGAGAIVLGLLMLLGAHALLQLGTMLPRLASVGLVGSLGGWYSAFGGASKDAPIEGFDLFKFFRSPILAAIYALLLSPFQPSPILLAFAGLGFTIATLETYKTFFFPSKPRGKFAGKPILFPEMLVRRRRFVPAYVMIWTGLIVAFISGYGSAPEAWPEETASPAAPAPAEAASGTRPVAVPDKPVVFGSGCVSGPGRPSRRTPCALVYRDAPQMVSTSRGVSFASDRKRT